MTVVQSLEKLFEEITSERFLKSAGVGDVIEEFTAESKFKNNVNDFTLASVFLGVGSDSELDLVDDILMLEMLHGLDLGDNELFKNFVRVVVNDFDSILLSGGPVSGQLDFAAGSLPNSFQQFVVSNLAWHDQSQSK